ncbi:hypothetical protein FE257_000027 [Aspergillus nanangensis]|uniref:Uncharacterized protein n=1 Tax=Aspergillus nanangensis TaxID=2582783 RepID=A0AAD4CYM0_ASPNN|nr:hypothetical protein FE257_000027 [Aspergillus nanangensis]
MGQPSDPPPSYEQATASSSIALPPTSSTPPPQTPSKQSSPPPPPPPLLPEESPIPSALPYPSLRAWTRASNTVTLAPHLSQDASSLHSLISRQAHQPPRPHLIVRGEHVEHRTRPDRKENESRTVVDFDFTIDLTPYFLPGSGREDEWRELRVVGDADGTKAFRGGRWRARRGPRKRRWQRDCEYGAGEGEDVGLVAAVGDQEEGEGEGDTGSGPGLMGWCERFCSDRARVKSFRFDRSIVGFDATVIRSALTSHLRTLNYHGTVVISTSLTNKSVTVYSPHWINQLRNTGWVYYVCVLLPLWLMAWPIIWLLERRYCVVSSVWFFARSDGLQQQQQRTCVTGRDEAAVAQDLAPVVMQAAWERRTDGRLLTEPEMRLLRELQREGRERGGPMRVVQWDRISRWGVSQTRVYD